MSTDYQWMMSGGAVVPEVETGRPADAPKVTSARDLVVKEERPERIGYELALAKTRALKSAPAPSSAPGLGARLFELAKRPGPLGVPWGVYAGAAVVAAVVAARRARG